MVEGHLSHALADTPHVWSSLLQLCHCAMLLSMFVQALLVNLCLTCRAGKRSSSDATTSCVAISGFHWRQEQRLRLTGSVKLEDQAATEEIVTLAHSPKSTGLGTQYARPVEMWLDSTLSTTTGRSRSAEC